MTATPAAVLKRIESLDDDFEVFWARASPPKKALIDAAEKKLGAKLRDDHRALIRTMGGGAVLAKESAWPRAKELDVRPAWQFWHGVEIFGVAPTGDAPAVDVVVQSEQRAPSAVGKYVAAMRRVGDRGCVGYDAKGRLFAWAPGEAPEALEAEGLLTLLHEWLEALVADKDKMKAAKRPGPVKKPKGAKDPGAEIDEWLGRLEDDRHGKVEAELARADPKLRQRITEHLLAKTAGKRPDEDAIYKLPTFADDPRVVPRLLELATHKSAEVRDAAVSMIDCLPARPAAAVPLLVAALADSSEDVRSSAAEALATYAPPGAVEPLAAAFARQKRKKSWQNDGVTGSVLKALGACGAGRADVVDLLVEHLALENAYATLPAFEALVAMGPQAKRAIPALEALASGDDPYREMHARHALATITGNAKPHLARLRAGLEIKDVGGAVAASARLALQALGVK